MTTHGQGSGFAFLSTTFGFDVRSGRKPMDLAAIAAVDVNELIQSKSGLNLAPLQETLDDLVFGALPAAANGKSDASSRPAAFENLFELGQLSCEMLLADQDLLVQRLEAAQRGTNKARKRTLAYRDRARGYTSQANTLKTSNVRRAVSLRKLQGYVLDARERAEAAEDQARRSVEPALHGTARVVGNKENLQTAPRLRRSRLSANATTNKHATANVAAASTSRDMGGGGINDSSALLHPLLTQPAHSGGKRIVGPSGVFDAARSEAFRSSSRDSMGQSQQFSSTYPFKNTSASWRPRSASPEVQVRSRGTSNKRRERASAHSALAASAPAGASRSSYDGRGQRSSSSGRHAMMASSQDRSRWARTGNLRVDEIATALEVLDRRRLSEARAAASGEFTRDHHGGAYEDEYGDYGSSHGDATEDNSDSVYGLGHESNGDNDYDEDDDDDDDDSGLVADAGVDSGKFGADGSSSNMGGLSTRGWAEGEVTLGLSLHHNWDRTSGEVVNSAESTMQQLSSTMAVPGSSGTHQTFGRESSKLPAAADPTKDSDDGVDRIAFKDSHVGKFFATTAAVSSRNDNDDDNRRDRPSKAPLSVERSVEPPASPKSCASDDADCDEILQVLHDAFTHATLLTQS